MAILRAQYYHRDPGKSKACYKSEAHCGGEKEVPWIAAEALVLKRQPIKCLLHHELLEELKC